MYRDEHHITATLSRSLAPMVADAMPASAGTFPRSRGLEHGSDGPEEVLHLVQHTAERFAVHEEGISSPDRDSALGALHGGDVPDVAKVIDE